MDAAALTVTFSELQGIIDRIGAAKGRLKRHDFEVEELVAKVQQVNGIVQMLRCDVKDGSLLQPIYNHFQKAEKLLEAHAGASGSWLVTIGKRLRGSSFGAESKQLQEDLHKDVVGLHSCLSCLKVLSEMEDYTGAVLKCTEAARAFELIDDKANVKICQRFADEVKKAMTGHPDSYYCERGGQRCVRHILQQSEDLAQSGRKFSLQIARRLWAAAIPEDGGLTAAEQRTMKHIVVNQRFRMTQEARAFFQQKLGVMHSPAEPQSTSSSSAARQPAVAKRPAASLAVRGSRKVGAVAGRSVVAGHAPPAKKRKQA